jgi:hypothetical protein
MYEMEYTGPKASLEYTLESIRIVKLFLLGMREPGLKEMLDMEDRYPGRGWKQERQELIDHFKEKEPTITAEELPF